MGYPEEVCGFLLGHTSSTGDKTVSEIKSISNAWEEKAGRTRRTFFAIPPAEYLTADREARERGESIIGFYHSHPDHPAQPSGYDLLQAQQIFPGYSYIIVSVARGQAVEAYSWVLRDDSSQFDSEPLLVEGELF